MSRMVLWILNRELQVFIWVNQRLQHAALDFIFSKLTHLGGATFTIAITSSIALFASSDAWKWAGLQGLVSLTLSHIPVAVIKKSYKRLRPYIVIEKTLTCSHQLSDHSFPSGHTAAIFSVIIPIIISFPWLSFMLLPLAATVALSRIYLGQHYPTDVAAGCFIGIITAWAVTVWMV
jgi:undecaprenyl-diphosphatase